MKFSKIDINNLTTIEKGSFIRNQINKEYLLTLDFKYLTDFIESWWKRKSKVTNYHRLKIQLQNLLLNHINKEDFYYFDKVGLSGHYADDLYENIDTDQVLETTPRLLYRSKGPRAVTYFNMIK